MSADDGIYILQTGSGDKKEYRVAHCMAIDNISCPDLEDAYTVLLFGKSEVFTDITMAQNKAFQLFKTYSKYGPIEYGISTITLRKTFPGMSIEEAKEAIKF